MRSAAEHLKRHSIPKDIFIGGESVRVHAHGAVIDAINAAREEAIKECAERAKLEYNLRKTGRGSIRAETINPCVVDKQSILSLLEQNK